jgi:hypothetical protein
MSISINNNSYWRVSISTFVNQIIFQKCTYTYKPVMVNKTKTLKVMERHEQYTYVSFIPILGNIHSNGKYRVCSLIFEQSV